MCIHLALPEPPALAAGISLEPPALPSISVGLDVCCKHVGFSIPTPFAFPTGVFQAGMMASLTPFMTSVQTFLDALLPDCPLE